MLGKGTTRAFGYCPECQIKLYQSGGYYTCPLHGKYERSMLTGELLKSCTCDDCLCKKSTGKKK